MMKFAEAAFFQERLGARRGESQPKNSAEFLWRVLEKIAARK